MHFGVDKIRQFIAEKGVDVIHFEVKRTAKTLLIHLIPNEFISDYHLDSYSCSLYCADRRVGLFMIGTNLGNLKEGVVYKVDELA